MFIVNKKPDRLSTSSITKKEMKSDALTPEEYIQELPEERKDVFLKLRNTIIQNLPAGFEETMIYGMIGYVVPLKTYPKGYHCTPNTPLTFINIASQKNFIALYHSGIYANPNLCNWFKNEYPKHCTNKLDMGKSCVRFKNIKKIPFELISELCTKMSVKNWIDLYESSFK